MGGHGVLMHPTTETETDTPEPVRTWDANTTHKVAVGLRAFTDERETVHREAAVLEADPCGLVSDDHVTAVFAISEPARLALRRFMDPNIRQTPDALIEVIEGWERGEHAHAFGEQWHDVVPPGHYTTAQVARVLDLFDRSGCDRFRVQHAHNVPMLLEGIESGDEPVVHWRVFVAPRIHANDMDVTP